MDLISGLSQAMGIDNTAAQALAGAAMATVQGQAAEESPAAAAQLGSAVPELGGWLETAKSFAGGAAPAADTGMLGGLMGLASSGAGNQLLGAVAGKQAQHTALLVGVLSKAGLDASKASMAAPVVLQFLQSRLDAGTLETLLSVAPFLTGGTPPAGGGGAAAALGALGSMFGGK